MGPGLIVALSLVGLLTVAGTAVLVAPVDLTVRGERTGGQWRYRLEATVLGRLRLRLRLQPRPPRPWRGLRKHAGVPRETPPQHGSPRHPRALRLATSAGRDRALRLLRLAREWVAEAPGLVRRLLRAVEVRALEVPRLAVVDPAVAGWALGLAGAARGLGVPVRLGRVEVIEPPSLAGLLPLAGEEGGEEWDEWEMVWQGRLRLWPGRVVGAALRLATSRPARRLVRRTLSRWWRRGWRRLRSRLVWRRPRGRRLSKGADRDG